MKREMMMQEVRKLLIKANERELRIVLAYPAIKEEAYIEVTSYGGDATGYQIPFTVHYTGVKVSGAFDVKTKTFTAAT